MLANCKYVLLTGEVIELIQCLHNNGNERKIELSNMGSDLRITVARVCIMAAQQGVNSTNCLFMKEKNPVGERKKVVLCISYITCVLYAALNFISNI